MKSARASAWRRRSGWQAGPAARGSDNWPWRSPRTRQEISLPVHQIMLVVNGIHLLEIMKLDELAAKKASSSRS